MSVLNYDGKIIPNHGTPGTCLKKIVKSSIPGDELPVTTAKTMLQVPTSHRGLV